VAKRLIVFAAVLVLSGLAVLAQSKPSIQGVWRSVEVTITAANPAAGTLPKGTHTSIQPSLLIFTGKHYSTAADTAAKPRPTTPFKVPGKPTAEEMQSQWGPFAANSGTYELSGTTLTRRAMVAKNPSAQGGKNFTRYTIKLDGSNLWMTAVETAAGKAADAATVKYVRVE
jgi:hypothetical protein